MVISSQPSHSADAAPPLQDGLPIKVLVVDDQALIRRGLTVILGSNPDIKVIGEAEDGAAAVALSRELRPDIVLMDLIMPNMGGVAATRALCAEVPGAQVVVLTTFDAEDLVLDAIRAGAQAYLLKDASETDVLDTIRAVHRGESRLAANIARKVLAEIRRIPPALAAQAEKPRLPERQSAVKEGGAEFDALTAREEEILELIAQGLSNKEIGRTVNLAEGTIKNYVSRIMDKLQARTRTQLAVKVVGDKKT